MLAKLQSTVLPVCPFDKNVIALQTSLHDQFAVVTTAVAAGITGIRRVRLAVKSQPMTKEGVGRF